MDTTTSPPQTPLRQHVMSPIDTTVSPQSSPSHSFRGHLSRRTSSFSSNHDRSPVTPKNRHRFSNASQLSGDFGTPVDEGRSGLGNLADELGQLEDNDEYEEGETENALLEETAKDEASRDSGIDVSYRDPAKRQQSHTRNFSKPFSESEERPPDGESDQGEDKFSPDLEDLMTSVNRMTCYTDATEDPLIPRTVAQMQDLGNQTSLEAAAQRFTTSTNSMTAHLTSQSKSLQTFVQSLYPMFAFSAQLDPVVIEETIPLLEALQADIPQPDILPVQKLQKLNQETGDVIHALSQLTDTLQMGKQITTAAARHLRTTQNIVEELRRERELAELARHELGKSDWEDRIQNRWHDGQCKDIISGFEDRCNALRGTLEAAVNAGA